LGMFNDSSLVPVIDDEGNRIRQADRTKTVPDPASFRSFVDAEVFQYSIFSGLAGRMADSVDQDFATTAISVSKVDVVVTVACWPSFD